MNHILESLALMGLFGIVIIIMIASIPIIMNKQRNESRPQKHKVLVEIKEGTYNHVKVKNLEERTDIYCAKIAQIDKDKDKIHKQILQEKANNTMVIDGKPVIINMDHVDELYKKFLALEEEKNKLEEKILKCNMNMEKIALSIYNKEVK